MATDRGAALAALNDRLLAAYSARTVAALRASLATRIALPYIEPVLELNVRKEMRKDALAIRRAAAAVATGAAPAASLPQEIFVETQAIDAEFLASVADVPVRLQIRYADIEPTRVLRIRYVLHAACRILRAWRPRMPFRAAVQEAFAPTDLEVLLSLILDLYARETRALSQSLELPPALKPVGERALRHLGRVMSDAGALLARDLSRLLYRHAYA